MVRLVKCLPCKNEDLGLTPRTRIKMPAWWNALKILMGKQTGGFQGITDKPA